MDKQIEKIAKLIANEMLQISGGILFFSGSQLIWNKKETQRVLMNIKNYNQALSIIADPSYVIGSFSGDTNEEKELAFQLNLKLGRRFGVILEPKSFA